MAVALCQHLFGPLVNLYETLHKALVDFNKVLVIFQVQLIIICEGQKQITHVTRDPEHYCVRINGRSTNHCDELRPAFVNSMQHDTK